MTRWQHVGGIGGVHHGVGRVFDEHEVSPANRGQPGLDARPVVIFADEVGDHEGARRGRHGGQHVIHAGHIRR